MEMRIVVTLFLWTFEFLPMGKDLNGMTVVDYFIVRFGTCYVKVKEIRCLVGRY